MTYPYVDRTDRLQAFMERVPTIDPPEAVDHQTLRSLGFDRPDDEAFLDVLRYVGLMNRKGGPTPRWAAVRVPETGRVALAKAIRHGYKHLFLLDPKAHAKDYNALRAYFSANADADPRTVVKMARTFETICRFADFSGLERR